MVARGVGATVMDRSADIAFECVIGSCPQWVGAGFAEMYPDDAIVLPTEHTATLLASDDDWDWIADHPAVVARVVDHLCFASAEAGPGRWVVATGAVGRDDFELCSSTSFSGSTTPGVGGVILFARAAAAPIEHVGAVPG